MTVTPITEDQAIIVADWRNESRHALRTGWTTPQQQSNFVSTNMTGSHMYWWFSKGHFNQDACDGRGAWEGINAAGGLVNIDRRVRNAEISLIVGPKDRGKGFGTECVEWILNEGFQTQNLKTIYGEVYACGAVSFWQDKVIDKYECVTRFLPNRAYWEGGYWDSMYFSIDVEDYREHRK